MKNLLIFSFFIFVLFGSIIHLNGMAEHEVLRGQNSLHDAIQCGEQDLCFSIIHAMIGDELFVQILKGKDIREKVSDDFFEYINARDVEGKTPLLRAIELGDMDLCSLFIHAGADVNKPFRLVSESKEKASVESLFPIHSIILNRKTGLTDLDPDDDTMESSGSDSGDSDQEQQEFPRSSSFEIIEMMVDCGADLTLHGPGGYTPLHLAAGLGFEDVCIVIIEHARRNGFIEKIVNTRDAYGKTPLHWASQRGFNQIIKLLIESGAAVGDKDNTGKTPLHLGVLAKKRKSCELLVKRQASLDEADVAQNTPRSLAKMLGMKIASE